MPEFEDQGLRGGLWRGRLTGAVAPRRVVLVQHAEVLAEARVTADGGDAWRVEVDVPASVLTAGIQTLLLKSDDATAGDDASAAGGEVLSRLTLMAGRPLDEDLTTEIAALRAELELVKREFRRFAAERTGR